MNFDHVRSQISQGTEPTLHPYPNGWNDDSDRKMLQWAEYANDIGEWMTLLETSPPGNN
jgi:hypothetical protein